ncbi:MAG: hypothetical protein ABI904_22335 [Chloroflexota bacterium]
MIINHDEPRWALYPMWIIQSFFCIPIALLLDFIILTIIILIVGDYVYVNGVRHITEDYLYMYFFIPTISLLTGAFQSALLRRYLPGVGGWVLATTGGWLLGILLVLAPDWLNWRNGSLNLDLAFLSMGLAIGIAQWLLLRRRLSHAGWWIAANVAGWGLLSVTTGNTLDQFGLLALGLLPASVTAAALALLMKQVIPIQPNGV